jgi:tetratricopeptide (TPR) repeat protein
MSLKNLFSFAFIILVVYSCKTPEKPKSDPFAKYSKKERDSLGVLYDAYANYMAQPTEAHRIAKDSAIMAAPDNIEYIQELSYSYKKRGEHIKAMKILNDAVAKDVAKGSIDALEYRAWSLIYFYRDYQGTIADVDLVNKMSKRNYNICWGEPCGLLKGQALYKLGRYHEALAVFDTVLKEEVKLGFKAEDNFLVHFYVGRCYHQLKKYQEALQSYNAVLKKDENYTEALYQVGMVYKAIGENDKAKSYLEKALYWVKKGKKMGEPYFERFDEVFEYQINDALAKL